MLNNQKIVDISPNELLERVSDMKELGLRLIVITCTKKDKLYITYSFDCKYNMENLRLCIDFDTKIESISRIYEYAYLYENEIKDLFDVKIKNLSIDFKGNLYKVKKEDC